MMPASPTFIQQCPTCNAIHENRRSWDEYCDQHSPYSERVGRVDPCPSFNIFD